MSLPQFFEVIIFCVLLYVYKRRNVKHIVVVMLLVSLLGRNTSRGSRVEPLRAATSLFCCLATRKNWPLITFVSVLSETK